MRTTCAVRPDLPRASERGVDLDELQGDVENLLALLKDRQPGLFTWNNLMGKAVKRVHEQTKRALGK